MGSDPARKRAPACSCRARFRKTFVIIRRILHLVENRGVDPSSILVITFTKAAAKEMKERFSAKTEGKHYPVNFGTFHAVYYHILKTSYHYHSGNIISDYEKKES